VKEKRSDWWKAIAGLAVVALLAVGLGLLFRGQGQTPAATGPTATTTATCTPAPTTTPVSTATPTGTPGPRRLSQAAPLSVPEGFRLMDLCGDTVAGSLRVNDEPQIVLLNLTTGAMKQISSATGTDSKGSARISARWVVWIEMTETAVTPYDRWLKAYDREAEHEYTLKANYPIELDLSGGVVVWEEYRGDILAQDLGTGQRWAIAERPGAQRYPRISGPWVIYLDWADYSPEEQVADLWAYNLESGENLVVGQVYDPPMSSSGTYHALSGSRVVWTTPMGADYTFQVLSFDLDNPQDQPSVVMSPGDFAPESLHLFDDILVYHWQRGKVLYDLRRGEELTFLDRTTAIFISGDQVVGEALLDVDGRGEWSYRLYTATIEQ